MSRISRQADTGIFRHPWLGRVQPASRAGSIIATPSWTSNTSHRR
jgi:hypothetical protein